MAIYGAYHLANNPEIYEPMRNNTFELIVIFDEPMVKAGASTFRGTDGQVTLLDGTKVIGNDYAQEVVRFSVNKVHIPNFTQGVININRGNTQIKFAGTMTFEAGSMEVIDYIGADSKSVLMAWQRLSGDIENETVGRAANYKKEAYLVEYGPEYGNIVREWKIQGAWVSQISNDENSHEGGNDKRVITATIQFDKAVLQDPDLNVTA